MKKILSIVLAVAMMSTVAMAGEGNIGIGTTTVNPDSTITAGSGDFVKKDTTTAGIIKDGDMSDSNFTITKKFSKGSNLVKSVAINNDDDVVEIKTIQDYTLTRPTSPNVMIEKLELKAKKNISYFNGTKYEDYIKRGEIFTLNGSYGIRVGYVLDETQTVNGSYAENGMVKFQKDGSDISYGEASYDNGDISITGRVYAGDKIFTKFDAKIGEDQKAALKLYPEADLRFVNFTTNGLSANNEVIVVADEDEFLYEIVDGKVVASRLKYDDDLGGFAGKIRSSVKYVISDVKLDVSSAVAADPANPETGANDVVGVAAALAVVSLVAAGAVSLKK